MSVYNVVIPKLGEAVIEATITRWLKQEGDLVQEDEPIVEIATDKVDSEINSPVNGKLVRKERSEGDVVPVGAVFAILETDSAATSTPPPEAPAPPVVAATAPVIAAPGEDLKNTAASATSGTRFYSPLVRSIAQQENIPFAELDRITGTGKDDRLTRQDLLNYIRDRKPEKSSVPAVPAPPLQEARQVVPGESRIVEMDRIRQLISDHMIRSLKTSAHVTSFQEADMSRVVRWRENNKDAFFKRENEKLTYTPVFIEAIARAVRDFPMVNVSVDGTKIIVHNNVNIGMAVALPNFNLIVPVVRNAHEKSLLGLVKTVNDLAGRARNSKLVPDEITGGTLSLTNLGSFGTLMGTPIINQPQTAIIAVGAIKKRAVVIESPEGDTIAIRPMMMVSVTYDHRVIDGSLAGQFLNRVVYYLENFDPNQSI